jgi:DNA-binding PadR family transcriptional regulator
LLTSLPEEGFVPRQPDIGHLYRVLRAMEARGLLTSEWALETSGPLKRVYTITPAGHEAVGRWLEDLKGLRAWLDRFLELCEREVQKDVG